MKITIEGTPEEVKRYLGGGDTFAPVYVPSVFIPPNPCVHDFPSHQVGDVRCSKCGMVASGSWITFTTSTQVTS